MEIENIGKKLDCLLMNRNMEKYDLIINKKYINRMDEHKLLYVCIFYKSVKITDLTDDIVYQMMEEENGEKAARE